MTVLGCRFCRENRLLIDAPLLETKHFYLLASQDPDLPLASMIVPHRHSESPFGMSTEEWSDFNAALAATRAHYTAHKPDGFTLGWNVGTAGGQHVLHTHLHVIPRFVGEPLEGKGIRNAFKKARQQ